jgi:restriction system protein
MNDEYNDLMVPWHRAAAEPAQTDEICNHSAVLPSRSIEAQRSSLGAAYQDMLHSLCLQLTGYIYAQDHVFFEKLVVDVICSLGYGGRRRDLGRSIGRSGDGGIDGVIAQDELGLDVIYLQAKRLKPGSTVAVSAVRDFVGSLEAKHATKGIFVTTGTFSAAAQDVVNSIAKKIILINGRQLTELMTRYNIGVKALETLQFKEVDLSYFSALAAKSEPGTSNSASIQPWR